MSNNIVKLKSRVDVCERDIITALLLLIVITKNFTGRVTLHFNQGGITDYERFEGGLKKRIN